MDVAPYPVTRAGGFAYFQIGNNQAAAARVGDTLVYARDCIGLPVDDRPMEPGAATLVAALVAEGKVS
jgi:hypothetical protein